MSKRDALTNIRAAKSSHMEWRSLVQGYVSGMHVDATKLPLIHTDSYFARWYYTEGQRFTHLRSYKEINLLLEEVFEKYRALYKALHTSPKKAGLFQSKTKAEESHKQAIQLLMDDTFNSSQKLMRATADLEDEVRRLTDAEYDNLF